MPKRQMVLNGLIKNSIAAYLAAVELHNKPNIAYRYETVSLLLLNAWELILKAFIRKNTKKSIFESNGHTIKLRTALEWVSGWMEAQKDVSFKSVKCNIELLDDYRNECAHFYSDDADPIVFSLIAKAALNYSSFVSKYFKKDVFEGQNLTILPLGFELPFEPEGFLSKQVVSGGGSQAFNDFVGRIITVTDELETLGVSDSVVLGFTVHFDSTRKVSNADILAKIDNADSSVPFIRKRTVRVTDDPSAQPVRLSDEEFFSTWPLDHAGLASGCRDRISGFKQDKRFNKAKELIRKSSEFASQRVLDRAGKSTRWYYSPKAIDEVTRLWPSL